MVMSPCKVTSPPDTLLLALSKPSWIHGDSSQQYCAAEKVLVEEAMKHLHCFLVAVRTSQDGSSSVTNPRDPIIPHQKISLHWLLKKMLSFDCSVPKTSKAILSMEHFISTRMKPEDPW